MYKIGLKLWSINENYIPLAIDLFEKGYYNYIELYSVPDSYDKYASLWSKLDVPFVIHAPHFGSGLNFSLKEKFEDNKKYSKEALKFADLLNTNIVIFHPGVNGEISETIRQIKLLYDERMVIENKPYLGNGENLYSLGSTPEEIRLILGETNLSLCFDFGHAICSANAHKREVFKFINEFLSLKPVIYHLTDGDWDGLYDKHLNYGKGSFPIQTLLSLIPDGAMITNEAAKNYNDSLDDFIEDMIYLKNIQVSKNETVNRFC